jgi:Calcineurin-like phosphoesterase
MMSAGILHVTDFHIRDPKDPSEYLRLSFYDEYLRDLPQLFHDAGFNGAVSAIVATGDFVDRGTVDNFSHAATILRFFASRWAVAPENIITCIGNHDVVRTLESAGKLAEARAGYQSLAKQFAGKSAHVIGTQASVGRLDGDIAFVTLDATRSGFDTPGILEDKETDDIVDWIKGEGYRLLVICSHFPTDIMAMSLGPFEDPGKSDWYRHHIWDAAAYLRDRIVNNATGPVAWLSGDIHRETVVLQERVAFCTTGRLGTSAVPSHGEVRRQVSLIELTDNGVPRLWRAEFRSEGVGKAQKGAWTVKEVPWHRLSRVLSQGRPTPMDELAVRATPRVEAHVELIDLGYEEELIRQISEDGLYSFGRFETGVAGQVCLGWVSIDDLCTMNGQFDPVVRRMAGWILARVLGGPAIDLETVTIVGLDAWGAMIGSQLALKLGLSFLPVSSRGEGKFARLGEKVDDDECVRVLGMCKVAILVTDVVGTGRSLRWVTDRAKAALGDYSKEITWFAVSMICDSQQPRGHVLDFLRAHGSLCTNLRMPLCDETMLPPREVLPPNLSYRAIVEKDR